MTNRLAQSLSLYLRKHAENPIEWWPWCAEALETAKRDNKPIFLSIGYSSCHWCTVMEGEAFSNPAIAEYMNANFLPIKVDREERPDIDSIYMQALQMMTGQGGWPLNIFLAPDDLVPFYGGTYFPVEPRYGRPGFLQLLQAIRRYYDIEKLKLQNFKTDIITSMQQAANLTVSGDNQVNNTLDKALFAKGIETNTGIIAADAYGPNFPMIPYSELTLRGSRFNWEFKEDAKQASLKRGLDLILGGIFDHVAGGFHRYTVDATWTVPHFEKMLYDNGQIIEFLANLWSNGAVEPAIERAIANTVKWLKREMTSPAGYFYAAQDADSFINSDAFEPEEGAFYVWNYQELEQLLTTAELEELSAQFTITPLGNFEGKNVLQRRQSGKLNDTVENALAKLFLARYGTWAAELSTFPPARNNEEAKHDKWPGKIPAVTDTKMIVAWNSLMISGLARAYGVFGHQEYLDLAVNAANFICDRQWINNRFHRLNYEGQTAILAQSEDYAFFIKALLDLQQVTINSNDKYWLEKAVKVQEEFDEYLWSLELGGYYNTAKDASNDLLVRERNYVDNATPSANGIAISNLVRLSLLTNNLEFLDKAEQALQVFSSVMERSPQACPSLFTAYDWYLHHTLIRSSSKQIENLISQYIPVGILAIETNLPPGAIGLVCQGLTCQEPALSAPQLLDQIKTSQIRE